MNREIKFRAWDKAFQYFINWSEIKWMRFDSLQKSEDFVFQQFTGLKDKNGKEIYEGDLIAFRSVNNELSMEVKFVNGAFTTELLRYIPKNCEVIGNIFENSSLLDKNTIRNY
jgi:hypothetical protein